MMGRDRMGPGDEYPPQEYPPQQQLSQQQQQLQQSQQQLQQSQRPHPSRPPPPLEPLHPITSSAAPTCRAVGQDPGMSSQGMYTTSTMGTDYQQREYSRYMPPQQQMEEMSSGRRPHMTGGASHLAPYHVHHQPQQQSAEQRGEFALRQPGSSFGFSTRAASAPTLSSLVKSESDTIKQQHRVPPVSTYPHSGAPQHIPNIVVDPVPQWTHQYRHSCTPPFVHSDFAPSDSSQWSLNVPSVSKKPRTNSDSAIYEAGRLKEETHYSKSPSSHEFHALRQWSATSTATHISTSLARERGSLARESERQAKETYPNPSLSAPSMPLAEKTERIQTPVSMEIQPVSPAVRQTAEINPQDTGALNLTVRKPVSQSTTSSETTSKTGEKPMVPFIWKFPKSTSAKTMDIEQKPFYLRRHSDSNLPTEPEDLSLAKSASLRSSSTTEAVQADEQREGSPDRPVKERGLKKYLQRKYLLSLEGSHRQSMESDDVFSPSPGVSKIGSRFFSHDEKLEVPSKLTSPQMASESKVGQNIKEPLTIKTEALSPVSSESGGEPETPSVFLSPAFSSPRSFSDSPHPYSTQQGSVFQFHSPSSRSPTCERELEPPSSHPRSDSDSSHKGAGSRRSSSYGSEKSPGPETVTSPASRPPSQGYEPSSPMQVKTSQGFGLSSSQHSDLHQMAIHRRLEQSQSARLQQQQMDQQASAQQSADDNFPLSPGGSFPRKIELTEVTPDSPTLPLQMLQSMDAYAKAGKGLPPLASMLRHPSFSGTQASQSSPQPPFLSYSKSVGHSPTAMEWTGDIPSPQPLPSTPSLVTQQSFTFQPPQPSTAASSRGDKHPDPSRIIYCPFGDKVQEQRYQRDSSSTFMCPVCGQIFPSYNYLANHMVNHLPSEVVTKGPGDSNKVHLCKVCNRSFSRSDMLTRHMRLHTGLRPYECRVCGQVFSRSDHLHTHLRTHTGEKPYKCPQCPYAAPRRDMITRHMRIHMKQWSRRGRRNSSTGSADTQQSSFSSSETTDPVSSTSSKRAQSLSLSSLGSLESEPSYSVRHGSDSISEIESSHMRHWSLTSTDSIDSPGLGPPTPGAPPTPLKSPRQWALYGPETSDPYPSPKTTRAWSGGSILEKGSSDVFTFQHRHPRTQSVTSIESCEIEEQQPSPYQEASQSEQTVAESSEIQSSFHKCRVGSDKDSASTSGSEREVTMSPSSGSPQHSTSTKTAAAQDTSGQQS